MLGQTVYSVCVNYKRTFCISDNLAYELAGILGFSQTAAITAESDFESDPSIFGKFSADAKPSRSVESAVKIISGVLVTAGITALSDVQSSTIPTPERIADIEEITAAPGYFSEPHTSVHLPYVPYGCFQSFWEAARQPQRL